MKNRETPIEKDTRSKEDIERGMQMRNGFMATLQSEITHAKLQLSFAIPGGAEYEYWTKELQNLYHQKETYGR